MIYFDTAASYPVLSEVNDTLKSEFALHFANSSSSHKLGELIDGCVQKVRVQIADKIGAFPSEIVFTSGATEANNIAFKSILLAGDKNDKRHIITSSIEHKCVFSICSYLTDLGYEVEYISPNSDGIIDPRAIENAIRSDTVLVSIMHVNNELGSINAISKIGSICTESDVIFHTDAAQSFCKLNIDIDDMNIDVMSITAHKIGGPKGIGAIYIRNLRELDIVPVIHGAGQEGGVRGGTLASPLISAFGTAIECFPAYYSDFLMLGSKAYLTSLLEKNNISFRINGADTVANIISLTLPTINVGTMIREYEESLCLARGSACSSREIESSHVLLALGLDRAQADNTLRISFELDVSKSDIDFLVNAIICQSTIEVS